MQVHRYRRNGIVQVDYEAVIDEISGKIAARAINELRHAPGQRAVVADAWLVMQMSEGMDLWLDAIFDMPRQR